MPELVAPELLAFIGSLQNKSTDTHLRPKPLPLVPSRLLGGRQALEKRPIVSIVISTPIDINAAPQNVWAVLTE